ncbi:ComF family protein [Marixanthotalea marina]|uniref:ComF family protein n=1 Tax=Marixanthotalea marina TaxID=2844359 RepID=UPI002989A018|nr:phosphoribosyltransferase family protein [Marixanthotalea marina]
MNHLNDNEEMVCVSCRHDLPITNFHLNDDDTVLKVFYGRAKVENATALFRFEKKGLVQQLIHGLKYKGYENISPFLGDWLGGELKSLEDYQNIDAILPVPLHKNKLRSRGYNQVEGFGKQIASALNAEYLNNVLLKVTNTASQTDKKRFARWNHSEELFTLENAKSIENKHILLVDDIITTGATLEACISVLNQAKNVKISVACMAMA